MLEILFSGRSLLAAGGLAATSLLGFCAPPEEPPPGAARCGDGDGLEAVVLTAQASLACVPGDDPSAERPLGAVTGLEGEVLVGIDMRVPFSANGVSNGVPAEGTLYGLGSNGGVYSIEYTDADTSTAVATKRAQLDQALSGTSFGVDFNPTVDRLRIVSDTGQNLRANVDTGATIVDGTLNMMGTVTGGVVGAAYTNNDTDPATGTTLYDLDAALDQVLLQSPPNAGGLTPVGALGVDAVGEVGFDLYSDVRVQGPVTTTTDLTGWATLEVGGVTGLYDLTPFSGAARLVGAFDVDVVDLAFPLQQR